MDLSALKCVRRPCFISPSSPTAAVQTGPSLLTGAGALPISQSPFFGKIFMRNGWNHGRLGSGLSTSALGDKIQLLHRMTHKLFSPTSNKKVSKCRRTIISFAMLFSFDESKSISIWKMPALLSESASTPRLPLLHLLDLDAGCERHFLQV